jgi:hypothetical protein
MEEIVRNVTIFTSTKKRLAKRFAIEPWAGGKHGNVRVHYMEPKARKHWWTAWGKTIVIVDGWDHPEFGLLIRGFQDAPVQQGPAGLTFRTICMTVAAGEEPVESKYELEFKAYIQSLDPAKILFDGRQPTRVGDCNNVP